MSYDDLEIGEDTMASVKYMESAFGNIADLARQKIRTDLLTYCGQDTGGMIDILKKLQELVVLLSDSSLGVAKRHSPVLYSSSRGKGELNVRKC